MKFSPELDERCEDFDSLLKLEHAFDVGGDSLQDMHRFAVRSGQSERLCKTAGCSHSIVERRVVLVDGVNAFVVSNCDVGLS